MSGNEKKSMNRKEFMEQITAEPPVSGALEGFSRKSRARSTGS